MCDPSTTSIVSFVALGLSETLGLINGTGAKGILHGLVLLVKMLLNIKKTGAAAAIVSQTPAVNFAE
jgi:hypothetical protein